MGERSDVFLSGRRLFIPNFETISEIINELYRLVVLLFNVTISRKSNKLGMFCLNYSFQFYTELFDEDINYVNTVSHKEKIININGHDDDNLPLFYSKQQGLIYDYLRHGESMMIMTIDYEKV